MNRSTQIGLVVFALWLSACAKASDHPAAAKATTASDKVGAAAPTPADAAPVKSDGAKPAIDKSTTDAGATPGAVEAPPADAPAVAALPADAAASETTAVVMTAGTAPEATEGAPPAGAPATAQVIGAVVAASAAATEGGPTCYSPYRDNDKAWYPGLPGLPLKVARYNDNPDLDKKSAARFTDGAADNLLNLAMERANALNSSMEAPSRKFFKRLMDLHISTDTRLSGEVKVKLDLWLNGKVEPVELRGQIENFKTVARADVKLIQPPVAGKAPAAAFAGLLTCADVDQGCKHILLRIDKLNSAGKIVLSAYIVQRWGAAQLTAADEDVHGYASAANAGQKDLGKFFAYTLNNICVRALSAAPTGCALEQLQKECGGKKIETPAAKSIGMRTWVVAYGRSGFELSFSSGLYDGVADFEGKVPKQIRVSGALVNKPVKMTVENLGSVDAIVLRNNDTGGNLNFQVQFKKAPKVANTFFSVSSVLVNADTQKSVEQSLKQMPTLVDSETSSPTDADLK